MKRTIADVKHLFPTSVHNKSQFKDFTAENVTHDGTKYFKVVAHVRYDDHCNNGYNSFAITGSASSMGSGNVGGCIHDILAVAFPELQHLIKWHGVTSEGPLSYLSNVTYLAGTRDYNGLLKGESRQIRKGGTDPLCWKLAVLINGNYADAKVEGIPTHVDCPYEPDTPAVGLRYVPWCRIGEGKESEIVSARNTAVWPDATLEQLLDEDALLDRLPGLLESFKADMEALGFTY